MQNFIKMKQDLFQAPDYYNIDELLTEEHKLIRDSAREWVKENRTWKATSEIVSNKYQELIKEVE